jgi:prolyl-tRNA synthetase
VAAAGPAGAARVEAWCARRWTPSAPRRSTSRAAAPRALRGHRPLDRVRPNIFRLKDRKGGDYLLGPTHEELFTLLVKGEYSSYKDYPVILYQIQTKYRDEARPAAGHPARPRVRDEGLLLLRPRPTRASRVLPLHRDAYVKIFDRLGLQYVIVAATSGAMGGRRRRSSSPSPRPARTRSCAARVGYAANVEAVTTPAPPRRPLDGLPAAQAHHTPDTPTIETLVDFLNGRPRPHLHRRRHPQERAAQDPQPGSDEWTLLGVGVPGDREVDMKRLEAALDPAEVALLDEADFARHPFLVKGYIGPVALAANGVRFLVDPRIVTGTAWVTGADKPDHHVVDLVLGRDFTPDGTIEAAEVRDGDPRPTAPARSRPPAASRSGTSSSSAASTPTRWASTRSARTASRPHHDGLLRRRGVAARRGDRRADADEHGPRVAALGRAVDVHLVVAGKSEEIVGAAEDAGRRARRGRHPVLLDDRKASPGVKFADAELVGVPTIVVVGRGMADGKIEVKDRRSGEREEIPLVVAVEHLAGWCAGRVTRSGGLRSGSARVGAGRRSRRTGGRVTGGDWASPSASATAHCPPCV